MKKLPLILFTIAIILSGCNITALKSDDALRLINKDLHYPKVIDYGIYCSDPAHAKKILIAGLEDQGLVHVQKNQKLKDFGKPLIAFTDKARPYFLSTPDKDKKLDIQKVKIADEVVANIKILATENHVTTVEYTTVYQNLTPFSGLLIKDQRTKKHIVYVKLSDSGWIVRQPLD